MRLSFRIEEIQHIKLLDFSIDIAQPKLTCIVGKNGTGKTTLIKAIQNLCTADVFHRTSATTIFKPESKITYGVDGNDPIVFTYDSNLRVLNSKSVVPKALKKMISVELPAPHGSRFSLFRNLASADGDIRTGIVTGSFEKPKNLVKFLNEIYGSNKFDDLIEVRVKAISYYCLLLPNSRYIREDYLSSGEYFLLSLYRHIQSGCRLIVIDEIDISLDAIAQSKVVEKLRAFCQEFGANIIFTTHSLAMIKTLKEGELLYMEETELGIATSPQSYNSVKSMLFGFRGWDKYILTEDECLQGFLEFLINRLGVSAHYQYKIIYVGGGTNVTDLMNRNSVQGFFSSAENVISILDGDQRGYQHVRGRVFCIPIESVEKQLALMYQAAPESLPTVPEEILQRFNAAAQNEKGKILWKHYGISKAISVPELYQYVFESDEVGLREFTKNVLSSFLERPAQLEVAQPILGGASKHLG